MARIDEVREEMKVLRDRFWDLRDELCKLEQEEQAYYIGCEVRGDEDYWDEYYHPLGFITTTEAKGWLEGQADEYGELHSKERVFRVDEDTHRKYIGWNNLEKAIWYLEHASDFVSVNPQQIEELKFEQDQIIKELKIKYPSYQHPGDIIYVRKPIDDVTRDMLKAED